MGLFRWVSQYANALIFRVVLSLSLCCLNKDSSQSQRRSLMLGVPKILLPLIFRLALSPKTSCLNEDSCQSQRGLFKYY